MIVIGLTGQIASGKSFVAAWFEERGVPVFYADKYVHELLKTIEIQEKLKMWSKRLVTKEGVDKAEISKWMFEKKEHKKRLENLLHPKVREAEKIFIERCREKEELACILEVPLLFETGAESLCDYVFMTMVNSFVQRQRALNRPGMTKEKLDSILESQARQKEYARKADILVHTGLGKAYTHRQLRGIYKNLVEKGNPCGK